MTIYANILHVPYMHNLAMAFPEHLFYTDYWNKYRYLPNNVIKVDSLKKLDVHG